MPKRGGNGNLTVSSVTTKTGVPHGVTSTIKPTPNHTQSSSNHARPVVPHTRPHVSNVKPVMADQVGGHLGGVTDSKKGKKGGTINDDIKNLAVPFAILLAKQGLDSVTKTKKTSKKNKLVGGNCGPCSSAHAQPQSGGRSTTTHSKTTYTGGKMEKLSKAIDNFLQKY
jgi:hypothetical protein